HSGSPPRPCSAKEARKSSPHRDDRIWRAAPAPRRRRSAEIVRFHLQKVPEVPRRDGSLRSALTHRFSRRAIPSIRRRTRNKGEVNAVWIFLGVLSVLTCGLVGGYLSYLGALLFEIKQGAAWWDTRWYAW